jgi:uncharacterized glyoxalase superfamily protein PhnB
MTAAKTGATTAAKAGALPAARPTTFEPIPKQTRATIIPCLRYRDAPAAIEWLCHALGFEATRVVRNEDGTVAHAQLTYGNGMIMLGSVFDTEYGRLLKQPSETGGYVTQGAYLVVNDADAVHARVVDAGGEVLLPLQDEDYGGRGFTCRDPEGVVWSIGSYDPWAELERAR